MAVKYVAADVHAATTSFCVREAYAASCPHHLTMP